jgi:sarcosine oxidase gamma subunit
MGHCARTLLAQAAVLLHLRSDAPVFELYVPRSYRDYVRSWLVAAAGEFVTDKTVRLG